MLKKILLVLYLFGSVEFVYAQSYQGPDTGSVASGTITTTNSFLKTAPISYPHIKKIRNIIEYEGEAVYDKSLENISPKTLNYFEDPSLTNSKPSVDTAMTILLHSFQGINETNSIPPDPYIAVGANHIVAAVNSRFAIWDKDGNLAQEIDSDEWYNTTLAKVSTFDPKVLYDHFAQRWIMVWLDEDDGTKRGNFLLSV
ncbi:MAG: hypothetical protein ABI550_09050, partial [Ignavibacteriaceae bacterium]